FFEGARDGCSELAREKPSIKACGLAGGMRVDQDGERCRHKWRVIHKERRDHPTEHIPRSPGPERRMRFGRNSQRTFGIRNHGRGALENDRLTRAARELHRRMITIALNLSGLDSKKARGFPRMRRQNSGSL